jgi:hypothetical protein
MDSVKVEGEGYSWLSSLTDWRDVSSGRLKSIPVATEICDN